MRTALYVPGSSDRMLERSRTLPADVVILDLEDAVSEAEKPEARRRVAELLRSTPSAAQRWVRVNPVGGHHHAADLDAVLPARPDAIVLAKAEPDSVAALDAHLAGSGEASTTPIVALVETALGLHAIDALCRASTRLVGLQLGAEDLTAELGVERTDAGDEIRFARHRLALAARAYGLEAIDTPSLVIGDDDLLAADAAVARSCGMTAKTCIHPSQLAVVAAVGDPTAREVDEALRIVAAADDAERDGRGAAALDGRMIDAPVVARARRTLAAHAAASARP